MSAIGYNDTLNTAYMPTGPSYLGPTGGNWINWTVNANTIQAVGPTGATGTTMTLSVPSNGIIQGTIGGTGAMLLTTSNVYLGQGAGWNKGDIIGYTGAGYGYGQTSLFGITGSTGSVGIGVNAAAYGQSSNTVAIGNSAGIYNQGPGSVAIGYYAAGYTGYTGGYLGGQGVNSVAIGYQAAYQNDNTTVVVTPYLLFTTSSVGSFGNNITPAISYTGQYMMICTNSGSFGPYISNNYGQVFNSVNITTGLNVSGGFSQTGQYVFLGNNNSGTTFYYSYNFGITFFAMTLPTSCNWTPSTLVSYSGQYVWYFPVYGGGGSVMYSLNGNTGVPPTFYTLPATSGLTAVGYIRSGMDGTGQYIVTPWYTNTGTGIANTTIYYSVNATSGKNVFFTNLSSYSAINGLPILTNGWWYAANISGNGKYMLMCSYGVPCLTYLSSNAGSYSTPSTITFSPINQLQSNTFNYSDCSLSFTGQYMCFLTFGTGALYVSYNYGLNWSLLYTYAGYIAMSGNGNYIIATPNNQVSSFNCIIFVLATSPSNTNDVAIGYQAGYQNQQGSSIAIGTNAGYASQPVNSVAIGNNAGYTRDFYTYGPYQTFVIAGYQLTAAMSYDGKLIFVVNTANAATVGSINYGQSFASTVYPSGGSNIINGGIVCTSSAQYIVTSGYNTASVPVYYSSNGTSAITSITFTSLSTGPPRLTLNSGTSIHIGINPIAISSDTGQYILVGNYYAASNTIGNQLYYSSNGGTASTSISQITFTNVVYNTVNSPTSLTMVTSGLIAAIDASDPASYPGTGTTINDISPSRIASTTLSGPWTFVSNGQASYWSTTNGPASSMINTVAQNYMDFCAVFYPDMSYNPPGQSICGLISANNDFGYTMRFTCNGSNLWYATNPDNSNGWSFPNATTYYLNGQPVTGQLNVRGGWNVLGGGRTNSTSGTFAGNWSFSIGTTVNSQRNFQGRIAALYLYNRVLTPAEQAQNYAVMMARLGAMTSIVKTTGGWFQPSISSNGQYIMAPYSLDYTLGQSYLFYSANGNNIPSLVTFTSLLPGGCGIPVLQVNSSGYAYTRGTAMSSNGQYILVSFYGTSSSVFLSSNGGALSTPATITFTNLTGNIVNGVPNGFATTSGINYNSCAMSSSGQYMAVTQYAASSNGLYTSTNYGVNWVGSGTTTFAVHNASMSGDGSKIVVCCGAPANGNYVFSYTLQQNTVVNTIAIGYNAGYYNQPSGSFFVSTSSVRNQNNGQTSSGALAYSSTTGEVFYSNTKTFVIDHPLDNDRYLVHACLEGPEVGVYYRGTTEITNGRCVTVVLPAYVEAIAYDFTVKATAIQDDSQVSTRGITKVSASTVKNNQFKIYSSQNTVVQWEVYGKRGDINVEPRKDTVQKQGEGPYTYLAASA